MLAERYADSVTYRVDLHGGQARMKEAILYIAEHARDHRHFGLVKLNKILWRADFRSFRERGVPVTGRQYQRQPQGPTAVELPPIINDMLREGILSLERTDIPNERRPTPRAKPNLNWFSPDDLRYLDESLRYYRSLTATGASDDSHGVAWRVRQDGDPIPYEAALLIDGALPASLMAELVILAQNEGWQSE